MVELFRGLCPLVDEKTPHTWKESLALEGSSQALWVHLTGIGNGRGWTEQIDMYFWPMQSITIILYLHLIR